jgi:hypothetical protein
MIPTKLLSLRFFITTVATLAVALSAPGSTVFQGGNFTSSASWSAGAPSASTPGTVNVDGTGSGNANDFVVTQTGGTLTLTANTNLFDGSWTMNGGSIVGDFELQSRNTNVFTLNSGTIDILRLRTPQAGSTINQNGGSVVTAGTFIGGTAGSSYNLSGGSFQTTSINYNSTAFNLSGGSFTLTALNTSENSDRIRLWTVSGNVAMSVTAPTAIAVDRFNFANNWLPTATGATLTVSGWGQSEFESLFSTGRFQYDGQNLNATQFADIFQVSGSTLSIIPEPGVYAALIGLFALIGVMARRRF